MKARKATYFGVLAAGLLATQGAFADAEPESLPMTLTVEEQLTATFGPMADAALVPLTDAQMGATEGQLWPLIGAVVTLDGKPMKYNQKEDILNPYFCVIGATDRDWLSLLPDSE